MVASLRQHRHYVRRVKESGYRRREQFVYHGRSVANARRFRLLAP